MTIRAVIFDLDDTLLWDDRSVDETFQFVSEAAAKQCGVDPDALQEAVRVEARKLYATYETFPFTQNIGINPFEGLWGDFREGDAKEFRQLEKLAPGYRAESWTRALQTLGVEDPELGQQLGELFHEERRKRPYVYEETYQILDALKEANYKILLLTNGSPDLQQEKLDGVPELVPYFDHIMISGNFSYGKPHASIFEHAMKLLDIEASEAIMVGDKLTTDIKGANGVGMSSVWINRKDSTRTDEIIPSFEITNLMEILTVIDQLNAE